MAPIRLKDMLAALDARDERGWPIPFEITFVTFSRTKRTGGEVITMTNCIRKRHARQLSRADRREFVPTNRREIAAPQMRSDLIRLYKIDNEAVRVCYQRMIVAFNGREVVY